MVELTPLNDETSAVRMPNMKRVAVKISKKNISSLSSQSSFI